MAPDAVVRVEDPKEVCPEEMHIYAKGKHGFTLGLGTGHSTTQWKNSFMQWLKDINMIGQ